MSLCCISFRSILKLVSSVPWPLQVPANILSNVIMCSDAIIELQGVCCVSVRLHNVVFKVQRYWYIRDDEKVNV